MSVSAATQVRPCVSAARCSRPDLPACAPTPHARPHYPATALTSDSLHTRRYAQATITVPTSSGSSQLDLIIAQSQPLIDLLGPSAQSCLQGRGTDRAACNAVANLCVLNLYDP
jgi:hypothetical protein